jgi:RimJ/RimL family protein N-acetyltransferase
MTEPNDGVTVQVRDGSRIRMRPIAPEDRAELAAGFERLTPESRFRRFLSPMTRLSDAELDYLTQVDHRDHEALVAFDAETDEGIAVARYVRIDGDRAEPAVAVADDWQGRGVGTALLDALAERAYAAGIRCFEATVLATNARALGLLEGLGETTYTRAGSEVVVEVPVPEPPGAGPRLLGLLRAAAAGLFAAVPRLARSSPAAEAEPMGGPDRSDHPAEPPTADPSASKSGS